MSSSPNRGISSNYDDEISITSTPSSSTPSSSSSITTSNTNNYSNYSYYVEDTSEGCYRDISATLQRKLFTKTSYKKRSYKGNDTKKGLLKSYPLFIWTINEKDIDYNDLKSYQICNHFEGITILTTKNGLCNLLKDMCWINEDNNDISLRSYNLGDPIHRDEFIDDFRISAASNILKYVNYNNNTNQTISINDKIIRDCINAISFYLRIKLGGEWPCVERNFWQDSTTAFCGFEDDDWKPILSCSYEIADIDNTFHINTDIIRNRIRNSVNIKETRINLLLLGLASSSKQFCIDGTKNVWIVKAPEACRGVNMKVSHRLEDILECEKGMGGRTVQKYLECPLLAPLNANASINTTHFAKFDLRVWVLVISFVPLKAFIYPVVYGRRCGLPYDLNSKNFNDSLIHLTNFAIQKKSINPKPNNNTNSTTQSCKTEIYHIGDDMETANTRKENNTSTNKPTASQSDLLVSYDEVINIIGHTNWNNIVWPEIKRKIKATLEITKTSINARKNSFEFLGYDIIIDSSLSPWVLEVNMSPAMAHRNDTQSNVIANMTEKMIDIVLANHSTVPTNDATNNTKVDWELLVSEQPSNTNLTNNTSSQEWRQVTISQTRPNSAKASRPSSASSQKIQQTTTTTGIPIDFAIVGKSISNKTIDSNDVIISNFFSLVKIQKRALIFISRVRKYHHNRKVNSIIIQKYVRRYLGQCCLFRLIQRQKAIIIQCCIRIFLSKQRLLFKIKTIDATTIQSIVRMRLARLLFIKTRKIYYMKKILKWRRRVILVYQRKKVFVLAMFIRKWYNRRQYCKTIVFKYIRKNYHKRIHNAKKIKRSLRALILYRRIAEKINKKRTLRSIAFDCVIKCNDMMEKLAEKIECEQMNKCDHMSRAFRDYVVPSDNNIDINSDDLLHNNDTIINNSSSNSSPATSNTNSPSFKINRNGVHDNWSSIFENTTGIDMGLNNLNSKKFSSPTKSVEEIFCVEDFVAKHMSNSTNPVTSALNPKAKAYIRLLKRTLGVEYFNNNTNVKIPSEMIQNDNRNDEQNEKLSNDQPLSRLAFLSDDINTDKNPKQLSVNDELNQSIQQMEIAMKYYDKNATTTDSIIPQQPTSPVAKKVHKLRPKSATHRRTHDLKSNNDDVSHINRPDIYLDNNPHIEPVLKKKLRPKSASNHHRNASNQHQNDTSIPRLDAQYINVNNDHDKTNIHSYFNEMDKNHHDWVHFLQQTYGAGNIGQDIRGIAPEYGILPALPQAPPTFPTEAKPILTKSARPKPSHIKSTNSKSSKLMKPKNTSTPHTNSTNTNGNSSKVKKEKEVLNSKTWDPYDFSDDPYDFSEGNTKPSKKVSSIRSSKKVKIGFDDFFLQGLM